MPAAVVAPGQSLSDHPLVGMETATPGPRHAMSLPETPSDTYPSSATVILGRHGVSGPRRFVSAADAWANEVAISAVKPCLANFPKRGT